jgi:two-component system, cell cycle sensor histidine kinase and response regulator CckA
METNNGSPRRRHVVIVDDNAGLAWFFSEILKLHGYAATVLTDGKLALKFVLSQPADAIICDLQMPELDGDLFYATVERTNPGLLRRFIFVTGVAAEERFRKFVSTVEAPVLRKPVAVETLLREVERASR